MPRLGINQYGKAETHLVRVMRDGDVHSLRDLLVSVALSGSLEAVHVAGDNSAVLATDTALGVVCVLAVWIGLYPKPLFDFIEKPVDYVVRKVDPGYFDKQPVTYPSSPAPSEHHEVAEK